MKVKLLTGAVILSLSAGVLSSCGGSAHFSMPPAEESFKNEAVSEKSEDDNADASEDGGLEEATEDSHGEATEDSYEEATEDSHGEATENSSEEVSEENESEPEEGTRAFHTFQSTFSEGRAWVEYFPSEDLRDPCVYGLIDESGHVYLTTDVPGTPVSGGHTEVPREDGFDIYNAEGECTFSFDNTPELQKTVVGQGDGVFVVVEHATGFSGNVYYLYEIDGNGNEISSRYEVASRHSYNPDPDRREFTYLGSGIFACNAAYLYINNGVLVDISGLDIFSIALETPFVNGISVARKTETIVNGPFDTICTISTDDLQSADTVEAWFNNSSSFGFYSDASISGEGYMLHRVDPWGWEGSDGIYGVYDYSGNRLAVMPSYPSDVSIVEMGAYKDGYAPLLLRGADQYYYITMLNTNGEQLYEPVCLGKNPQGQMKSSSIKPKIREFAAYAGGDFVYKQFYFTGEDGYICIDVTGQSTYLEKIPNLSTLYDADEKYFYFNAAYLTDHKGSIVFDSVAVTEE